MKRSCTTLACCGLVVRWKKSIVKVQPLPLIAELVGDNVGELLGCLAGGFGGTFDLLSVLVRSGREISVVTLHALHALDRIGRDRRVGVPDVRGRIDVIDRSGYVVFHWASFR